MDDIFSKKLYNIFSDAAKSVAEQVFGEISGKANKVLDLRSKEFWSTRELVDRGWSTTIIDEFVKEGKLTRINAGGSAGFKYATVQLINILKNYDPCTSPSFFPGRKQD